MSKSYSGRVQMRPLTPEALEHIRVVLLITKALDRYCNNDLWFPNDVAERMAALVEEVDVGFVLAGNMPCQTEQNKLERIANELNELLEQGSVEKGQQRSVKLEQAQEVEKKKVVKSKRRAVVKKSELN
jgi:hypothetical protein